MEKNVLILMDLLVMCGLAGTIFFMRRVYGSIKIIREGRTELQQLLQQLNIHISNAQHSIDNMNKLADEKAKVIQRQIENANAAIDELQFIQRAADNVAQRLENATGTASTAREDAPAKTNKTMSKAEKELADAMAARRAKAAGE
jgi:hypothetical protein